MALIEYESEARMTREAAADKLREIADELSRHNEISFRKNDQTITIDVPDEVNVEVEISAGAESEIEIEISW
jgi:amphi-Trp domain-containing protein